MRDATRITDYFNGSRTLFIIPLYQRKYAWQQKHCSRLFEDLKKFIEIKSIAISLAALYPLKLMNTRTTFSSLMDSNESQHFPCLS